MANLSNRGYRGLSISLDSLLRRTVFRARLDESISQPVDVVRRKCPDRQALIVTHQAPLVRRQIVCQSHQNVAADPRAIAEVGVAVPPGSAFCGCHINGAQIGLPLMQVIGNLAGQSAVGPHLTQPLAPRKEPGHAQGPIPTRHVNADVSGNLKKTIGKVLSGHASVEIATCEYDMADSELLLDFLGRVLVMHQRELRGCPRYYSCAHAVTDQVYLFGIGLLGKILEKDAQMPGIARRSVDISEIGKAARRGA